MMISPLVYIKLFLRRFLDINSFCKQCGRQVRDYDAPDKLWKYYIEPAIKKGDTLCYNCFCDYCRNKIGISIKKNWKLQ